RSNPVRNPGGSTTFVLGIIDDKFTFPEGYKFILDGKLRSPWYDGECERAASEREIAQELDIDYMGSSFQFYNGDVIMSLIAKYCRPPVVRGELIYDRETLQPIRFERDRNGKFLLWFDLVDDRPPVRKWRAGADIATGSGASNSAISFGDATLKEKLAMYVDPYISPEEFGRLSVAACRWFRSLSDGEFALEDAFLIREHNGPGGIDGKIVVKSGFRRYHVRRREKQHGKPESKEPGWWSNGETKKLLHGGYRDAL